MLQQDNASVHTCKVAMDAVERNRYELIPHPANSPDLAPSDFFLFPNLKKDAIEGSYIEKEEMDHQQEMLGWLLIDSPSYIICD